jgi:hypothetical protein
MAPERTWGRSPKTTFQSYREGHQIGPTLSVLFLSDFTFAPCQKAKPINPAMAQKASSGRSQLGMIQPSSGMTVEATMRPIYLTIILARTKVGVIPIWRHLRSLTKCKANEPEESD